MASFLTFFNTSKYAAAFDKLLADPELDVLLVYGNHDQFFSLKKYEAWTARCRELRALAAAKLSAHSDDHDEAEQTSVTGSSSSSHSPTSNRGPSTNANNTTKRKDPTRLKVKMISYGDHFWRGVNGRRMSKAVSDWVERLQPLCPDSPSD